MNDNQFEALLAALSNVTNAIEELSDRVAAVAATIVKVGDPEGWDAAVEAFEEFEVEDVDSDDEDDDDDEQAKN